MVAKSRMEAAFSAMADGMVITDIEDRPVQARLRAIETTRFDMVITDSSNTGPRQ